MMVTASATDIPVEMASKLLARLSREKFWGEVIIHCENGKIWSVKKHQSIAREEMQRLTEQ